MATNLDDVESLDVRIAVFIRSFIKGCVPLALACLVFHLMGLDPEPSGPVIIGTFLVAGIVLWFGWRYVRANIVTTFLGILLAIVVGGGLLIFVIAVGIRAAPYLLIFLLIAVPLLLYDLFIRAPHQGRFARARELRRNLRSRSESVDG